MKYLVDANVLSEATRLSPEPKVMDWMVRHEHELAVNPIILGELEFGILKLAKSKKRTALLNWFGRGCQHIPCLEIDSATASCWASLLAELRAGGKAMPIKDSLIAASARQHQLGIATRNVRDFAHCGVKVLDPFA